MNEFVSQFVLEARELTEQATASLLALENDSSDSTQLDTAFRAFHTLKGAAAIMEYVPMERMLHRAEDVLQGLRRGGANLTPAVIDGCLACIGQVIRWLDAVERTGELPADAEQSAARAQSQLEVSGERAAEPSLAWVDAFAVWARGNAVDGQAARFAVRYEPTNDAFFRGVDPVAVMQGLPGLLALRVGLRDPQSTLEEMQPFDCNLVIEALSSATRSEIDRALNSIRSELQIAEVAAPEAGQSSATEALGQLLIQSQVDFVRANRQPDAFAGILGSAGRLIANVLLSLGRHEDARAVENAIVLASAAGSPQPFLDAIGDVAGPRRIENPTDSVLVAGEGRRETGASAIRVDVEKVDAIVDLTGELLVVKNALAHVTRLAADGADPATLAASLRAQTSRLERHVVELQRAVLDLRVLPLGRVFSRFPLVIRETATKLGKQVAFRSEGDDTVADKAVVEALFEPLLHVVRNAIDHGIESPATRIEAGKRPTADLLMRAWREGEHVLVEVADDGRGVDTAAVRRLAVSRGIVSEDVAAAMADVDALELIFAPGFTTAATVTELSGRGVGMNAVRSSVERIGGKVSLTNTQGQGLIARFTLPFTVMMTRVMTVEAGGQVFGLPFDAVLETVRVPRALIRPLGGGQAFVLRDLTLPVLDLATSLDLDVRQASRGSIACLVVALVGGQRVAIEIERPGERLDLMLKPVEGLLAGMRAISGTSLLGDGRVLIVLDLGALFG